jgi:hypothetical protein
LAFFSIIFLNKLTVFLVKKCQVFAIFFGENIFKILTSVPDPDPVSVPKKQNPMSEFPDLKKQFEFQKLSWILMQRLNPASYEKPGVSKSSLYSGVAKRQKNTSQNFTRV